MTSLYAERLLPPDAMAAYYEKHYAVKVKNFSDARWISTEQRTASTTLGNSCN